MKKILAISGGIDSVSMLHMLRRDPSAVVAHFNHGIRESSDADAAFVEQLAATYQLPFVSKKENLGPGCSEAHARERRYNFLAKVCEEHQGQICTAHHLDDLIETIAINILRGTGWRGLVPFGNQEIHRPLIRLTKADIYRYAARHSLTFRHDASNTSDQYLRNRLRDRLASLEPEQKHRLLSLHAEQKTLKRYIDQILQSLLPANNTYQRSWFMSLDDPVAIEILRAGLGQVDLAATRPQLADFLLAIRTYPPHKKFNLPTGRLVTIKKDTFSPAKLMLK